MSYSIRYYSVSHIGKCRKNNQDNLFSDGLYLECENEGTVGIVSGTVSSRDEPIFGVFDGMGGEECGEVAAYIAARSFAEFTFEKKDVTEGSLELLSAANRAICAYAKEHGISSMGTTAAALKLTHKRICLSNIGDSKVFVLSRGILTQISEDHTAPTPFGKKPPLSQYLGIPEDETEIEPYVALGDYNAGDVYLICSDGLTDMLTLEDIERILRENETGAAEELLELSLQRGGRDNVTFIILYIEKTKCRLFNFLKAR